MSFLNLVGTLHVEANFEGARSTPDCSFSSQEDNLERFERPAMDASFEPVSKLFQYLEGCQWSEI